MIRLSVIIPVYNTAQYLRRCLNSVTCYEGSDLEIICINDGSTDDSLSILEEYASNDDRITIIDKKQNEGLLEGRRSGVQKASGNYLIHLDSDDYIAEDGIRSIMNAAEKNDRDILMFSSGLSGGDPSNSRWRWFQKNLSPACFTAEGSEILQVMFESRKIITQLWGKVYRTSLLKKAYEQIPTMYCNLGEDLFQQFFYGYYANSFAVVDTDPWYMYEFGTGISRTDTISAMRFQQYCSMSNLAKCLIAFAEDQKDTYAMDCALACAIRMAEDCCRNLIKAQINSNIEDAKALSFYLLDQWSAIDGFDEACRKILHCNPEELNNTWNGSIPKISVIVPVYNTAPYIPEFINSIKSQTLGSFEVLFVDDGSSDKSMELLLSAAEEDRRFRIFTQEHQGATAARNMAIPFACGEYLVFLDSDDVADPMLFEKTITEADVSMSDIVIYPHDRINVKGEPIKYKDPSLVSAMQTGEVFSPMDHKNDLFKIAYGAPWTKIYRKSFIERTGIRYQNLANSNDTFFSHMHFVLAEKIAIVNEPLVHYRVGIASSIQGETILTEPLCFLDAVYAIYEELNRRELFDKFKGSWISVFYDSLYVKLTNLKMTPSIRRQMLEAARADRFIQTGIWDRSSISMLSGVDRAHYDALKRIYHQYDLLKNPAFEEAPICMVQGQCSDPKISIVIPVYNKERYVEKTIRSLLIQDVDAMEILCLNDGSTDHSLKVLLGMAKEDSRISVYNKKNGGLSHTRNCGLSLSKGKYIYFLDADDWLVPGALKQLLDRADNEDLDVLHFESQAVYQSDSLKKRYPGFGDTYTKKQEYLGVYRGAELCTSMMMNADFRAPVWLYIVKRDHLLNHKIQFLNGCIHEDNAFSLHVNETAQRVGFEKKAFHQRAVVEDSIMTTAKTFANVFGYFKAYQYIANLLPGLALSPVELDYAQQFQYNMLRSAIRDYRSMQKADAYTFIGLDKDYHEFDHLVKKPAQYSDVYKSPKALQKPAPKPAKKEKPRYIPEIVWGGIQCVKDHGFVYTVGYAIKKIKGKIFPDQKTKEVVETVSQIPNHPHVSVIVPVYNVHEYLCQCIDSILTQTDASIELICVDDGSTDGSLEILREFEKKDPRVKVLSQNHRFAGTARNAGIAEAKGDYLYFADADDFMEKELIEHVYNAAIKQNADIVYFGSDIYDQVKGTYFKPKSYLDRSMIGFDRVFSSCEAVDSILRFSTPAPWNKLFKRTFVEANELKFSEFRHANDIGFTMPAAVTADRIYILDQVYYHLRRNHGGNLCATRSADPTLFYHAFMGVQKTLRNKGLYYLFEDSFVRQIMGSCMYELDCLRDTEEHDAVEVEFMEKMRFDLGISPRPKDYFRGCGNYIKYQELLKKYGMKEI